MKSYSAAYLDKKSTDLINSFGFDKESFHVTTCFDETGVIMNCSTVGFKTSTAIISGIVHWNIENKVYLIALLDDCKWTGDINNIMKDFGAVELLAHNPHITLSKDFDSIKHLSFKFIVGQTITFNRHSIKKML
jgi:hypothetical protein